MRRAPIVIGTTIAGLAAILSFRPQTSALGLPAAAGSTGSARSTTSGSGSTPTPTTTAPASSAATTPTSGSSGTTPPVTSSPTTTAGTRSATGDAVETPYGVVEVRVSVSGSTITNVQTVELTARDGHSASINSYAAPQLQQQVLQVQSAQIDGVSGATYTSTGYAESVQSALNKLGIA